MVPVPVLCDKLDAKLREVSGQNRIVELCKDLVFIRIDAKCQD